MEVGKPKEQARCRLHRYIKIQGAHPASTVHNWCFGHRTTFKFRWPCMYRSPPLAACVVQLRSKGKRTPSPSTDHWPSQPKAYLTIQRTSHSLAPNLWALGQRATCGLGVPMPRVRSRRRVNTKSSHEEKHEKAHTSANALRWPRDVAIPLDLKFSTFQLVDGSLQAGWHGICWFEKAGRGQGQARRTRPRHRPQRGTGGISA